MSALNTSSPPRSGKRLWSVPGGWLKSYNHPAPWLPAKWRRPAIGYLAVFLLELLAAGLTMLLQIFFLPFGFLQALLVLVIVVVALSWGQGPGLLATFLGAILLILVLTPPYFSWELDDFSDLINLLLFLAAGVIISLLASQAGRARWQAEQMAHQAEAARQRLQRVLEILPVGVCITDAAGQILETNAAIQALAVDMMALAARAMLREEKAAGEELDLALPDGQHKTILSFAVPMRDVAGMVSGRVVVVVDISERKQLEEALREANQQMDTFLGIVSHELKTPLTTIKMHFQLMERIISKARSQQPAHTAALLGALEHLLAQSLRSQLQVNRLDRLVNDLVDISRIQAGRLEIRADRADLGAIVREAVDEQRSLEPQRIIHLQSLPEQPIPVQADSERIGQVVTNYLTNALKYSLEEQPVEVGIQIEGAKAKVWVEDVGPGIPLEELAQIWERFHRARGVEVQSGSGIGLGLGLHISQEIIERHHGQIGVTSAPGHGSTFWFTLPLANPG